MSSRPKVLATICARGGSLGVPGKNVRPLLGRSIIGYTIDCAKACDLIGEIVVSTDSDEIAAAAEAEDVPVPFRRPAEFATAAAAKIHAIRHATEYVEVQKGFSPDIVVDLDIGVPMRVPADIEGCVNVLTEDPDLDAAVTVYEAERSPYFNMVEYVDSNRVSLVKDAPAGIVRRQDAPPVYSITPAVFAFRRSRLDVVVHLFTGTWGAYVMPRERAVDIDTDLDFDFVEFLMRRERGRGRAAL